LLKKGEEVPTHMQLPAMDDIIKLRQSPRNNNNKAFTFIVEHIAGAVLGLRKWKTTRCYAPLAKHMTVSDEAFMLLILENQYDLWLHAESSKVGRGPYTENGPNKKFCGWTNEGMRRFNKLSTEEVRNNRNKQHSSKVEEGTFKALAERHKALLRGSRKNSRRHHHATAHSGLSDDDEDDDDAIPQDDLALLATQIEEV
jgi:hypothetical protein